MNANVKLENFGVVVSYIATLRECHRPLAVAWLMAFVGATKETGVSWAGTEHERKNVAQPFWEDFGVSSKVDDALREDIRYLLVFGRDPWRYKDHQRKMARAQQRRAVAMADRKANPQHYQVRDSQRGKLYVAERAIHSDGRRFTTVEDMQAYVDKLIGSAWWKRRHNCKRLTVRPGYGHTRATCGGGIIQMPKWARIEAVLLHEMSHGVIQARYGNYRVAAHGREYAAVFVELVGHMMGKDVADKLKASFRANKVKFTKARTMTPERRAALTQQLAAAREKIGQAE